MGRPGNEASFSYRPFLHTVSKNKKKKTMMGRLGKAQAAIGLG